MNQQRGNPIAPTPNARVSTATGLVAALLAATCCLLPLALIAMGLAGAGLMMSMMRYEWLTLPLGVLGLAGAYVLHFRNRRQCNTASCRFVGGRLNQAILTLATLIVAAALLLRVFPSWTSRVLQAIITG